MGGKGNNNDKSSKVASELALRQYWDAKPIQDQVYGVLNNFMQGDQDPTQSVFYGPRKQMIENNYQRGLDNILTNMPAGGAMTGTIGDLEIGRAASLSDMMTNIYQDEWNKAYGVGTGMPQASISSLTGIGAANQAAQAQQAAGNAAATGGAAASLGSIIAAMLMV